VSAPLPPGARAAAPVALLVDDDDSVRAYVRAALEGAGWGVLSAADAEAALAVLAPGGAVDLLVTDLGLPGAGGRELAARVRAARPGVRVLFVSGAADDEASDGPGDGADFLQKPFTPAELLSRIRHVLAQPTGR
jgi:DNA-binding response OmpR family regulator